MSGARRDLLGGIGKRPAPKVVPFVPIDPAQNKLNDLFWEHGKNLPILAGYEEILTRAGLFINQITQTMLQKAEASLKRRVKEAVVDTEGWKVVSQNGETRNASKKQIARVTTRLKDKYGCMVGQPPAIINSAISTEYRTVEEISNLSGIPGPRIRSHLRYWLKQTHGLGKFLVKEGEKWAVKK